MIQVYYADAYFFTEGIVKDLEASPSMTKITNAGVDYMNGLEV
jgi:hypothetical protein